MTNTMSSCYDFTIRSGDYGDVSVSHSSVLSHHRTNTGPLTMALIPAQSAYHIVRLLVLTF